MAKDSLSSNGRSVKRNVYDSLPMAGRPYEQRLRAETAAENRNRILDALYDALREAPSRPLSVDEIARRARVARSTIYLVFGSRSGLFDALTDRLLQGAGYDRIVRAVRHADAREMLRGGLAGGIEMFAAHHEVLRALNAMAKLDPQGVGQALARGEEERSRGMAAVARRLGRQGFLRPGMTPERAAHVVWLLAGFDAYDTLASGRGLSSDQIVDVLVETAEHALLA
jgi:AcrR family transcriptional regulator